MILIPVPINAIAIDIPTVVTNNTVTNIINSDNIKVTTSVTIK